MDCGIEKGWHCLQVRDYFIFHDLFILCHPLNCCFVCLPTHRIGSLQPGDVLLAIDGQSLEGASPRDAADMLSRAFRDVITLTVRKDNPNSFS